MLKAGGLRLPCRGFLRRSLHDPRPFSPVVTITALFRTNFRMDFPFDLQELPAFAIIGSVGSPPLGVVGWGQVWLWVGRDPSGEEGRADTADVVNCCGEAGRKGRRLPGICSPHG